MLLKNHSEPRKQPGQTRFVEFGFRIEYQHLILVEIDRSEDCRFLEIILEIVQAYFNV